MTEVGPSHLRCCVGGAEVGPRWDRPTHVFVWVGPRWDRGGTAPPTFLSGSDRGGTEVGPPHPRFIRWDRSTPFGVYDI